MGRGSKVGFEQNARRRGQSKEKGSDESDEEYKLEEDEEFNDSDEYCSLDSDESEDFLADFEEDEKNVKVVVKPKPAQKHYRLRKKDQVKKPLKRMRVSPKIEDDDVDEDENEDEDEDENEDEYEDEDENGDEDEDEDEKNVKVAVRPKPAQKHSRLRKRDQVKKPSKRLRVSPKIEDDEVEEDHEYEYEDENEDEDEDADADEDEYEDEDEDEEFMMDESDFIDEEDEIPGMKKTKKLSGSRSEKRGLSKGKKRSRKSKVLKKPARQISRNDRRMTRNTSSVKNAKITKKSIVVQERSRNTSRRKSRTKEDSDSDFVSDFEYTISEEEREQVREANKFCTNFDVSSRSTSTKRSLEEETVRPGRRHTRQNGKEKVVEMKNEVINQVCGICLSEEGKRTVRGSLDCCSHYFCFACIMEWSKVESRCPLCKQRFMTISKPARSNTGIELRAVVIHVPERDQVYQPSEEELQGYLDPYQHVICSECQQGGEDALMLLCDICDSPAHTFCVGLGHEVPEGNWYCEGCRPSALASLNTQGLTPTPDQRASNISDLSSPFPGGIDLNAMYVPETPLSQESRSFSSFRRPMGDHHASSPISGTGAFTVFDRRRIHLQINNILNNRTSQAHIRSNGISNSSPGIRLFGSQLEQGRVLTPQRPRFAETAVPLYSNNEGRLEGNAFTLAYNRDLVPVRPGHFRGQVQNQTSTSAAGSLQTEHRGFGMAFNPSMVHEHLRPSSSSQLNIGTDASLSPFAWKEVVGPTRTSQGSLHAPF